MKAWRRTCTVLTTAASLPPAHVVSVVVDGDLNAAWTFDTDVSSIGAVDGLMIEGSGGASVVSIVGPVVTVDMGGVFFPGQEWELDAAEAAIVFSPAATISSAIGTVS